MGLADIKTELLPCPFCGATAEFKGESGLIRVVCTECFCCTVKSFSAKIVADIWNTRVTE